MSDGRLCIECLKAGTRTPATALCAGPSPFHADKTCDRGVCEAHGSPGPRAGKMLCPLCAQLPAPPPRAEGMLW